ncbi:hypothetical protein KJ682_17200 [bacterium]|nr:hypothetical protein [bacterium]
MSDVPFYLTQSGRRFIEVTMPELVRQLTRLNDLLALRVELLENQAPNPTGCCGCRDAGKQV